MTDKKMKFWERVRKLDVLDIVSLASNIENAFQYGVGPTLRFLGKGRARKPAPAESDDQPIVEGRIGKHGWADEGFAQIGFAKLRERVGGVKVDRLLAHFASEVDRIEPLKEKIGHLRAYNTYKEYANDMRVMLSGIKNTPGQETEFSQEKTEIARNQAEKPTGSAGRGRMTYAFADEKTVVTTAKWKERSGGSSPMVDILEDWAMHYDRIWQSNKGEEDEAVRFKKTSEQFRKERRISGMPMMPTPEEVLDHKKLLETAEKWLRAQNAKADKPYDDRYLPFIVKYPRRIILWILRLVVKSSQKNLQEASHE